MRLVLIAALVLAACGGAPAKHDPAIKIGRLVPEVLPWYSAAGITYPGKAGPAQ